MAACAAPRSAMKGTVSVNSAMGSGTAPCVMCMCTSISPGISVLPPRSTTRAPSGGCASDAGPIQAMRPSATSTAMPGRGRGAGCVEERCVGKHRSHCYCASCRGSAGREGNLVDSTSMISLAAS